MNCSVPCGGECCKKFHLSVSLERLAEMREEALARRAAGNSNYAEWDRDVLTVFDMLITVEPFADGSPGYTCRHHDAESGLCTIYDRRPAMCADYPGYDHGGTCHHCGYEEAAPELAQLEYSKAEPAANAEPAPA